MATTLPPKPASDDRLCILQTDSVLPEFQAQHGDYPWMFRRLLVRCGWPDGQLVSRDVVAEGPPPPGAATAYLITGSKRSVYDDEPWIGELAEFVRAELAARRKVVGICFGHQLLAHFFGGEVRKASSGWQVGVQQVEVQLRRPWMTPYASQLALLSSHQDQVVRLPSAAVCLGGYADCPVAAFELGSDALAIQGHPEFEKAYSAALLDYRSALLGPDTYAAGQRSLTAPTSSELVGHWIMHFLLADRSSGQEAGS